MPEFWVVPGDMTIGVFCHELGHAFNLPDLYDTDGSSHGLGKWSVMAAGSWNGATGSSPAHFDAWCKQELGFTTPVNITSDTTVFVPTATYNPFVYKVTADGLPNTEYFLVENRQLMGYDFYLPYKGILIYHCDDTVSTSNRKEWYPEWNAGGHYLVALEQAEGNFSLEKRLSIGDTNDPWPGNQNKREFSDVSRPNSQYYDTVPTFIKIFNISDSDSIMTVDFSITRPLDSIAPATIGDLRK
jgi:hypothetical protein